MENFISRLLRRSSGSGTFTNPETEVNYQYVNNPTEEITRRINGGRNFNAPGGFLIPPPPPMYPTRKEEPNPPMVSELLNKMMSEPVRTTPTTTSSILLWCGTTVTDTTSSLTNEIDPYVLDHKPLKRMLMKLVPWVLDVKEVRVKKFFGTGGRAQEVDGIMIGPLEIYIIVSPTHHSELMNPEIEVEVREKLFVHLLPLSKCIYPNHMYMNPTIIFSPAHSESILDYVK